MKGFSKLFGKQISICSQYIFLYPLNASEKPTVFWYFQGVQNGSIRNKSVYGKQKFTALLVFSKKKGKLEPVQMFQGQIINDSCYSKGSIQDGTIVYYPKSLFHFNYYLCPNCSLVKKQLILRMLNYSDLR